MSKIEQNCASRTRSRRRGSAERMPPNASGLSSSPPCTSERRKRGQLLTAAPAGVNYAGIAREDYPKVGRHSPRQTAASFATMCTASARRANASSALAARTPRASRAGLLGYAGIPRRALVRQELRQRDTPRFRAASGEAATTITQNRSALQLAPFLLV